MAQLSVVKDTNCHILTASQLYRFLTLGYKNLSQAKLEVRMRKMPLGSLLGITQFALSYP